PRSTRNTRRQARLAERWLTRVEHRASGRQRNGVLRVVTSPRSIDAVFGLESRIEGILAFEAALARASAREGVIAAAVADVIVSQCNVSGFDLASIAREAELAGNEAIPTIDQLRARVAAVDESAANWVHWGATSQDAIDTALVLQLGDALAAI